MNRLLYRFANFPALILMVAIGIALQTSVFNSYPFLYLQPDVVLLAVIWCGLRRGFTEGGILTLIFAHMAEIHSAAPGGLFLITYMLVYLGVRLFHRIVAVPNLSAMVMLTLGASIAWKFIYMVVLWLLGSSANQWRHMFVLLLPGAVMAGITAIWVYRWLEKFDLITFKDPRSRQSQEQDEFALDAEVL